MSRPVLLSVVVTTPETFESVRAVVGYLRAQSIRERLELVLVCPDPERLAAPPDWLDDFGSCELVQADPLVSLPVARAAGVRAASAEFVAFVEDHAFPAEGWAEAVLGAHAAGHAGVGSVMVNLNPRSAVSWTDLFLSYGAFVEGSQAGVVPSIPHDNSSYQRSALLDLEPALEALLGDQAALQRELHDRGHTFYLEERARLLHLNFSRRSSWLRLRYLGGRAYAGERAEREGWSRARRFVWAGLALPGVASEIAPVVRDVRGNERHANVLARMLPALAIGLVAGAAGKVVGYALGPGTAPQAVTALSFDRPARMRAAERSLAAPPRSS